MECLKRRSKSLINCAHKNQNQPSQLSRITVFHPNWGGNLHCNFIQISVLQLAHVCCSLAENFLTKTVCESPKEMTHYRLRLSQCLRCNYDICLRDSTGSWEIHKKFVDKATTIVNSIEKILFWGFEKHSGKHYEKQSEKQSEKPLSIHRIFLSQ